MIKSDLSELQVDKGNYLAWAYLQYKEDEECKDDSFGYERNFFEVVLQCERPIVWGVVQQITYHDGYADIGIAGDKLHEYLGVELGKYLWRHFAYYGEWVCTEEYPTNGYDVEGDYDIGYV